MEDSKMKVGRHHRQRRGRQKKKIALIVKKSKERVSRQGSNKETGKGDTHQCINK
jgi:hypothetical protein